MRFHAGFRLYGKILGDIHLLGLFRPPYSLRFTYYLNPDGTPNLESDPAKNLFKDLPPHEQPNSP